MRTAWRLAIVAAGLTVMLTPASAGGAEKPHRPPKPKLELLTETQEAVLRNDAIKVRVRSRRGREARVKAGLVVDGFPDDYSFRLGPESRRLRDREAKLKLPLSARQAEVLAFAEQACGGATLTLAAKAGKRQTRLEAPLRAKDC
jgi:hypothetical protein